jgi:arsenate reductase
MQNVLFLSTSNSARSIMAEVILNEWGGRQFAAYSAGSHPHPEIHANTLRVLGRLGHDTRGLRPKSWDEFRALRGPRFDFVITVCNKAAREPCPITVGKRRNLHWDIPDPIASEDGLGPFIDAYVALKGRIAQFVTSGSRR